LIPAGANLLANTLPGHEGEGVGQLRQLLIEMGERNPAAGKTGMAGLIYAKTKLNIEQVMLEMRTLMEKHPDRVRYITRLTPIDTLIPADLKLMMKEAQRLGTRIGRDETFKIVVGKRCPKMSDREIITNLAAVFDRKVNLTSPDWILFVEVMGDGVAMSLQKPGSIVSTARLKGHG